jgi:ABC-type Mn2+/Zn2+ transport system ATPase subunit
MMQITIRNLTVQRGTATALRIDALDIPAGVTTLVGPNGSGKSTLLHAIAGLLPVSGEVRVLGHDPAAARRSVAYVLQTQHVAAQLPVTAREVVSLGRTPSVGPIRRLRRVDREAVDRALERMELTALADRHLTEMSGGQRQRVFIAQGLVQDAEVLLLDEPVAGLDMVSSDRIRAAIESERAAGRTVIVATHDLDEAARADHVVLLAGRVVAAGTPAQVLTPAHLRIAYAGRVLDLDGTAIALDDGAHHDHHDLTDLDPHHVEYRHTEADHHRHDH